MTPDELVEDHYGWKVNQSTNFWAYRGLGAVAAASVGLAFLA
jgi:hypothetical protein